MKKTPRRYYTPYQIKIPVEIEKIIEISDPIYTYNEVMEQIDLKKYLLPKEQKKGRPRYDEEVLLKIILFAFMENGYVSTRKIEKLCKTDIRFLWLLQERKAPSHMTIENFIKKSLTDKIEDIFLAINHYLFEKEAVDLNHVYIDGTKLKANANKYSWVWKKGNLKNRNKLFLKVTEQLEKMNAEIEMQGVKFGIREEYAIEYLEEIRDQYVKLTGFDPKNVIRGRGHRKTAIQKNYDQLLEYIEKLRNYAEQIEICGEKRNSYSKTDHDATFMRMKTDHMGNDQLLPGYNLQLGVCDGYITVFDIQKFASDMDCFCPLMERFHQFYGKYPEYPVADAGYGSYNNYLYCEEHGMKKYMKFSMYHKETHDPKYRENPYRSVNFLMDSEGHPICPNGKRFLFKRHEPIKGNLYGRTEEIYQCEDCSECPHRGQCHKAKDNRTISLNRELTAIRLEVIDNLNCIHGALLRMNRSIQLEGTFGAIKWNRAYSRARRRGLKGLFLEFGLICFGFNLYKYHLNSQSKLRVA